MVRITTYSEQWVCHTKNYSLDLFYSVAAVIVASSLQADRRQQDGRWCKAGDGLGLHRWEGPYMVEQSQHWNTGRLSVQQLIWRQGLIISWELSSNVFLAPSLGSIFHYVGCILRRPVSMCQQGWPSTALCDVGITVSESGTSVSHCSRKSPGRHSFHTQEEVTLDAMQGFSS